VDLDTAEHCSVDGHRLVGLSPLSREGQDDLPKIVLDGGHCQLREVDEVGDGAVLDQREETVLEQGLLGLVAIELDLQRSFSQLVAKGHEGSARARRLRDSRTLKQADRPIRVDRDVSHRVDDEALTTHDKIRFLYVLGEDFDGYSGGAMWEDTKVGVSHWSKWDKISLVTDHTAYADGVNAFGWMVPGEIKVFSVAELDDAKVWVAS
jgi:hypothetical protein